MRRTLLLLTLLLWRVSLPAYAATTNILGSVPIPLASASGGTGIIGPGATALTDASPIVVSAPAPYGTYYTVSLTTAVGATRQVGNPASLAIGQYLTFTFLEDGSGGEQVTWAADYVFNGPTTVNTAPSAKTTAFCVVDTASTLQCQMVSGASPGRSTSSTSDSPSAADCGLTITYTAATNIAVTLPTSGMPQPWCWIQMYQSGAGKVVPTISAAAPTSPHGFTGTAAQGSFITLGTPNGGTAWILSGDGS